MIVIDCIQGEEEWLALKAGIPGASNMDKIITSTGKPSKQAKSYLYTLSGERLLGAPVETYKNEIMERGTLLEEEARESFNFIMDVRVEQVGFIFDNSKKYGISPDGILSQKEGLEIKCPLLGTHIGYLDANKLPTKYIQQIQMSLLVTGFEAWYFMSYYPGLPPLIVRVERDESLIYDMKLALEGFCEELEELTERLRG